jgi:hypothetical protein
MSARMAALTIGRGVCVEFLYFMLNRRMAVHAVHAVLSNMSLVHKFGIGIFIKFVIFEVALEAPVFSDLAIAENHLVMAAAANYFILHDRSMIILHS